MNKLLDNYTYSVDYSDFELDYPIVICIRKSLSTNSVTFSAAKLSEKPISFATVTDSPEKVIIKPKRQRRFARSGKR